MISLTDALIRSALSRIGTALGAGRPIEILIVGGAAAVLTGQLPIGWTTSDVDAIDYHLPEDRDLVLTAAGEVGRELALPSGWLNEWGGLYAWTLPNGWQQRRINIGDFGRLRIFAASRLDLIAMKFIAHRERDLEHLHHMKVRRGELDFVREYLRALEQQFPESLHSEEAGRIAMACEYVREWKVET